MKRQVNPLRAGYSHATISANIARMLNEGFPQAQAIATSLSLARRSYRERHPGKAFPAQLRRNPVPPSSHAVLKQRRGFKDAADLYQSFTGHQAEPFGKTKINVPKTMLVVGECDGILYTTVRDGEKEKYIHRFKRGHRPMLAVSPDGLQLFIVGGKFRFTERGIDDDA